MNEPTLIEIRAKLETAARAVATLPPGKWGGWVVYLLEALQDNAGEGDYSAMLAGVAGDIDGRLEVGRW